MEERFRISLESEPFDLIVLLAAKLRTDLGMVRPFQANLIICSHYLSKFSYLTPLVSYAFS